MQGYFILISLFVVGLGIGVIRNAASFCNPGISEGSYSKLVIGGHTSLECEISSCCKVSKIIFEKNDPRSPTQWTPVYEGVNKTYYHALSANDNYTLNDRSEYAPFPTQHILYITHLTIEDHGKWRCNVFDIDNRRAESSVMDLYFAPVCNPGISEGSHSKLEVDGHASLECEISTCIRVTRIIFEKNNLKSPTQWTPVYEGANKSFYHELDANDNYTLKDRAEYAPFPTQHILYIYHLTFADHGKWRCIVFDQHNRRAESPVMDLFYDNSKRKIKTITPSIIGVNTQQILEFSCEVSDSYPKHSFIWTVNGKEYTHGKTFTHYADDGLWTVRNIIELEFQQVGEVHIGCKFDSEENENDWQWNNITIHVKESLTTKVTDVPMTEELSTINENNLGQHLGNGAIGYIITVVLLVLVISALSTKLIANRVSRKDNKVSKQCSAQYFGNENVDLRMGQELAEQNLLPDQTTKQQLTHKWTKNSLCGLSQRSYTHVNKH